MVTDGVPVQCDRKFEKETKVLYYFVREKKGRRLVR